MIPPVVRHMDLEVNTAHYEETWRDWTPYDRMTGLRVVKAVTMALRHHRDRNGGASDFTPEQAAELDRLIERLAPTESFNDIDFVISSSFRGPEPPTAEEGLRRLSAFRAKPPWQRELARDTFAALRRVLRGQPDGSRALACASRNLSNGFRTYGKAYLEASATSIFRDADGWRLTADALDEAFVNMFHPDEVAHWPADTRRIIGIARQAYEIAVFDTLRNFDEVSDELRDRIRNCLYYRPLLKDLLECVLNAVRGPNAEGNHFMRCINVTEFAHRFCVPDPLQKLAGTHCGQIFESFLERMALAGGDDRPPPS